MYTAPIKDLSFALASVLNIATLSATSRHADYSNDIGSAVLTEAARFASEVLEPTNAPGDRAGAKLTAAGVRTPDGFREAYRQFIDGGWPQLGIDSEAGGQGMPLALATAVEEIWFGANTALMLCPMLSRGAIEALRLAGSAQLKAKFLPALVAGETTGTMNLTESIAGSDLAVIRTRATPTGDHYRIVGQKIFITYGDHDFTDNIIHLVLARIDGAPAGVKGISLFVVPKIIEAADGSHISNDLHCVSLEHKLGIHASPTCVMSYGDREGAMGYLVGEAHHGLEYMFIMMNNARLAVGVQGIGMAERALQQATAWARSRIQGRPIGSDGKMPLPIIHHPDVRRMLLTLKAGVDAMRLLALYAALQLDGAHSLSDVTQSVTAQRRADLLIPIVKGWSTEWATELVSLGVQIHGGMGYIEETGIAQTLRDVRITSIYEGTTGIQANDLLGRKLGRDQGAAMYALLDEAQQELALLATTRSCNITPASDALAALRDATASILKQVVESPASAYAVSVPYLMLCGFVLGGWLSARSAHIATQQLASIDSDSDFLNGKVQSARFYAGHVLPQVIALAHIVKQGGESVMAAMPELI